MNYLGHIYFSNEDSALMLANLYGDFFKGSHFERLPDAIADGVKLHRSIDYYIDHHPSVLKILPELRLELPKIAPIAIDLFFDHLLAKNWSDFYPIPLDQFLADIYQNFKNIDSFYESDFRVFIDRMIRYNWISVYHSLEGLEKMSHGVGRKISFPNELHRGKDVFLKHEKSIVSAFYEYMSDANEHFKVDFSGKLS